MFESLWTKEAPRIGQTFSGSTIELAAGGGEGLVAGWASTPLPDVYGHIVANGAFAESIALTGLEGPRGIQLLIGHDWDKPAGVITKLEYRAKGLWIEAKLDMNVSYAADMFHAAKSKGGLSFSVGFRPGNMPGDLEWVEDASGNELLIIRKGQLREVSVVANPANSDAIMEFVKSADEKAQPWEKSVAAIWRTAASRNLPATAGSWDSKAASERLLVTADGDHSFLKRLHLVYNDAEKDISKAYQLPIADIVKGRACVNPLALKAAEVALKNSSYPDAIKARAQDVIDAYLERFEKSTKDLTLPALQAMLVDEGWVKDEQAAEGLVDIIKANLHLFDQPAPPAQVAPNFEKALKAAQDLRAALNNRKEA